MYWQKGKREKTVTVLRKFRDTEKEKLFNLFVLKRSGVAKLALKISLECSIRLEKSLTFSALPQILNNIWVKFISEHSRSHEFHTVTRYTAISLSFRDYPKNYPTALVMHHSHQSILCSLHDGCVMPLSCITITRFVQSSYFPTTIAILYGLFSLFAPPHRTGKESRTVNN